MTAVGCNQAFCDQKASEGNLVKKMINLLRVLRRGSIEKRVVKSCLFSCLKGRDLHELMLSNSDLLATVDGYYDDVGNEEDRIQTSRNQAQV